MPDTAAAVFEGLESTHERLVRLVEEIDAFYDRSAFRLRIAGRDREKIPALGHSFAAVEGGIEALGNTATEAEVRVVAALTGLEVW